MTTLAIVVSLTGQAWAVAANGERRALEVGDQLAMDETLITALGARVDLDFGNNQVLTLLGEQNLNLEASAVDFENVISSPLSARQINQQNNEAPGQTLASDGVANDGHNFVQLVRISEIIEADGITPVTVARIQEILRPLGMSLPEWQFDRDWRYEHSSDEQSPLGPLPLPIPAVPGVTVELQGAGPDGIYNAEEIGPDGSVSADITFDSNVSAGDRVVVTDGQGNILLDRPITQDELISGVVVNVPVVPGQPTVNVTVEVVGSQGETGTDSAEYPVDNLPLESAAIAPQNSEDAQDVTLDISSNFSDPTGANDLIFSASGLPDGLTIDPVTGIISGTVDASASQIDSDGDGNPDGQYTVVITVTDAAGNTVNQAFDWVVTNPAPIANNDTATAYEDTPLIVDAAAGVLANDTDPDGDSTLTVTDFTVNGQRYTAGSTATIAGVGQLTLNPDGSYEFVPAPGWTGNAPAVDYTISDGEGGTASAKLDITILPVLDISLSTTPQVSEGGSITVTATVESPVSGEPLTVTLNNGQTIVIAVGDTEGSVITTPRANDVYTQGDTTRSYEIVSASGGNVHINDASLGATASVKVTDTTDIVTAELTVDQASVTEGAADLVYTVTLKDDKGNPVTSNNDIAVTTDQGNIVIRAGSSSGSLAVPVQSDDVYKDPETVSNSITAVTETNAGKAGSFEALQYNNDVVETQVVDTIDSIFAQISVDKTAVLEGQNLIYTVSLVDVNGNPVTVPSGSLVTVNIDWTGAGFTGADLDNFATLPSSVTINGGQSQAPGISVITKVDSTLETSEALTATITQVQETTGSGAAYESLLISTSQNSATANILDAPTITAVDDNGTATGQITVNENGLVGSADTTNIATGKLQVSALTGLDSVVINGETITFNELQALAGTPQTVVIPGHGEIRLTSLTPTATSNGQDVAWDISYSYTLTDAQTHTSAGTDTLLYQIGLGVVANDASGVGTVAGTSGILGVLVIDDVPEITTTGATLGNIEVDETALDVAATSNFSAAFSASFGADDAGSVSYGFNVTNTVSGLVDSATGSAINLVISGSEVRGLVAGSSDVAFTINVDSTGLVTLLQKRAVKHDDDADPDDVKFLAAGSLQLTATATDGDGDTVSTAVAIGDRFSFRDDGPVVDGSTAITGVIDEKFLPTGSEPAAGGEVSVSQNLPVSFGADGNASSGTSALVFAGSQAALRSWLDANGNSNITFADPTGTNILTAVRGGSSVFTVTLSVDASGQAGYKFELLAPMKHAQNQDQQLNFDYQAVDNDGDKANGQFTVNVLDDAPKAALEITVNEDDSSPFLTTSADATGSNITISATSGGAAVAGTANGATGNTDYVVANGTVSVTPDGRISYTPNTDYSNNGSTDNFFVSVTDDTSTVEIPVSVNVIPVADAPTFTSNATTQQTQEDTAVALGFNAPLVTDTTDGNAAESGDSPERLGLITLAGLPAGAVLTAAIDGGSAAVNYTATASPITVLLSDGQNVSGLTGNTLTMTNAQFEALNVLPPADTDVNFTVTATVESYEVDEAGNRVTDGSSNPLPGASTTASVTVEVAAVTDPLDLTFTAGDTKTQSFNINEDTAFDVSALLTVADRNTDTNNSPDIDGSEQHWFVISGLPEGASVITAAGSVEVTAANPTVRVEAPGLSGNLGTLPAMSIQPPQDFNGDMTGVTVTLNSEDRSNGTVESDAVTLSIFVAPVANDIEITDATTTEDQSVAFLSGVNVSDAANGTEIITKVVFEVPTGWAITAPTTGAGWSAGLTGTTYTIESNTAGYDLQSILDSFNIQPPAHSSLDANLILSITTEDTQTVNGASQTVTATEDHALKITVTPVAETLVDDRSGGWTTSDSDGNSSADVTMIGDHQYVTAGVEDQWFVLGQENGFDLGLTGASGWSNEDSGSEKTFALLTPELKQGDGGLANAVGSEFRYSTDSGTTWVELVFVGEPIEVPVEYLSSLEFKAAPDFSGRFDIKVQTKTVDYDEDAPTDLSQANIAISGESTLTNVLIVPAADDLTTGLTARVEGGEDTAQTLSIRPQSSDPSEIFNVTISDIPVDATITYGATSFTATAGDTSFTISDFNSTVPMTIKPPQNSNEQFELTVAVESVDSLTIAGDPNSPYISTSPTDVLTVVVAPKGVADPASVITTGSSVAEADVDATGGMLLSTLISSAALTDTDGSESLTFKISGLPAGFAIEGATFIGGSGATREWSLTPAQLASAKLTTPANFNGTQTFDLFAVTTENDGDSLTEKTIVSAVVTPSPEATINLIDSLPEDTSSRLDFSIIPQNQDTDEVLDQVWIKVTDIESQTNFTLTTDAGGTSQTLADAAGNAAGVVIDDGWYKISGAALNSIYAQGATNLHGDFSFTVRYAIKDPAQDATVTDVTEVSATDSTYQFSVTPVTDQVTLAVTSGAATTLSAPGVVPVELNVGNTGADYDGSEQLTRIVLENVPDGVVVVNSGADFVGNNTWIILPDTAFNAPLAPVISLQVGSFAGGLAAEKIKISVINEDADNGQTTLASTDIELTASFTQGGPETPATIVTWEQIAFDPTEDTGFTLGEAITGSINAVGVTNSQFTVTLTDLPAGTQVAGMNATTINGKQVWSASGVGGDSALQALLAGITVTPPENQNSNNSSFDYIATLSTHTPSGGRNQQELSVSQTVTPVTDDAEITITAPAVAEGADLSITVDIANASDSPNWTLVNDTLYFRLTEPAAMAGGTLKDASGNTLAESAVSGVNGVPDGDYYTVAMQGQSSVNLSYTPVNGIISGSIGLDAWVQGQESGAANIKTTTTNGTANSVQTDVLPTNSGYDLQVNAASGIENPAASDKTKAIEISVSGSGLVDTDGSEQVTTVLLKGLPNDFLMYVGASAASAQLALADNAGGTGTNTWLLGNEIPDYIGILPPKNWSGTLAGLQLIVISGENSLDIKEESVATFDFTVTPVADGIILTPTDSFGAENTLIQLNLNASLTDLQAASLTDASTETATLQIEGLGEHAAFYIDGLLAMNKTIYDSTTDTYTISGLSQTEIDQLQFQQAQAAIDSVVRVRAQSVESDAPLAPSDWSAWAQVNLNVTSQLGTTAGDNLLWTGSPIDGRAGEDTVQLRFGESLSTSDLVANLNNIESLDLGIAGANNIGDGTNALSVADVLAITTDPSHVLNIDGSNEDTVFLDDDDWAAAASGTVAGYDSYSATVSGTTVTVNILDAVNTQVVVD